MCFWGCLLGLISSVRDCCSCTWRTSPIVPENRIYKMSPGRHTHKKGDVQTLWRWREGNTEGEKVVAQETWPGSWPAWGLQGWHVTHRVESLQSWPLDPCTFPVIYQLLFQNATFKFPDTTISDTERWPQLFEVCFVGVWFELLLSEILFTEEYSRETKN